MGRGLSLAAFVGLQILMMLHHERNLFAGHTARLNRAPALLMDANPVFSTQGLYFIAMLPEGYRETSLAKGGSYTRSGHSDHLAITAAKERIWVEESSKTSSILELSTHTGSNNIIASDAEAPVASADSLSLAYFRQDHGRSRIWLRSLRSLSDDSRAITPADLNVLEMAFLPNGILTFSAVHHGGTELYFVNQKGAIFDSGIRNVRYPAASPDGERLAYSRLERGTWNLWIRQLSTSREIRVTNQDCNDLSPTWLDDSKTLVYASVCGRGLWLTALEEKRVLPSE